MLVKEEQCGNHISPCPVVVIERSMTLYHANLSKHIQSTQIYMVKKECLPMVACTNTFKALLVKLKKSEAL